VPKESLLNSSGSFVSTGSSRSASVDSPEYISDLNGFGNFGNLNTLGGNGVSGDFITVDTFDITENQILSSVQDDGSIYITLKLLGEPQSQTVSLPLNTASINSTIVKQDDIPYCTQVQSSKDRFCTNETFCGNTSTTNTNNHFNTPATLTNNPNIEDLVDLCFKEEAGRKVKN